MSEIGLQQGLKQTLWQDGMFCLLGHSRADFIPSLKLATESHHCFVFQESQQEVFTPLERADRQLLDTLCQQRSLGCFFGQRNRSANLQQLLRDVRRLSIPAGQGICLILSENCFNRSSPEALEADLSAWRRFCRKGRYRLLFCIHGPSETLRPLLCNHSRILSGIATQTNISRQHYSLLVDHWLTPKGFIARREYQVEVDESLQLIRYQEVAKPSIGQQHASSDIDTVYTLNKFVEELYPRMNVIAEQHSNEELIAHLDGVSAATVILDCPQSESIETLATMIYQLRCASGENLKILARESQRCLRAADEAYLLRAGCNLIIPYSLRGSAVRSLIAAAQGMLFQRSLPTSLAKLIETRPYSNDHGYTDPKTFSRYARRAFDNALFSELRHVIVALEPLHGITIEQILGLCRLRREGDLLTIVDGQLYLFLYACDLSDVDTALNNSVDLPINDLFASRLLHHATDDIEELLETLAHAEPCIDHGRARKLLKGLAPGRRAEPAPRSSGEIVFAQRRRLDAAHCSAAPE